MTYRIALAYIHPGSVKAEFMDSVIRTVQDPRYDVVIGRKRSNTVVQLARNDVVRYFLTTDAEHLLFVDTDMLWHPDDVETLISKDVPIVSGLYLGIQDGKAFPVAHMWTSPGKMDTTDASGSSTRPMRREDLTEELMEVAGVGMGFCLIRRDVIEEMLSKQSSHEHHSCYPFAVGQMRMVSGHYLFLGEDITFCVRAWGFGFGSFLAPDVRVGHAKEFLIYPRDGVQMVPDEADEGLGL